jgi:phosphoglycolate phosphatase
MRKNGLVELDIESVQAFVGDGARKLIELSVGASGIDIGSQSGRELVSRVLSEYVDDYNSDPAYLTEPYVGIKEALEHLRERGIRLGVLSNKPDATVKQLAEKFFPDTFEVVMGGREGIPLKPSPDSAFEVCRALGVSPSEVAYFGDTAVDIRTAKAFGASLGVAVGWGFRTAEELMRDEPDRLIFSPSQIIEIIDEG